MLGGEEADLFGGVGKIAGGGGASSAIVEFATSKAENMAKIDMQRRKAREVKAFPQNPTGGTCMARTAGTAGKGCAYCDACGRPLELWFFPFTTLPEPLPHTVRLLPGEPVREEDAMRCFNEHRSGGVPQQGGCGAHASVVEAAGRFHCGGRRKSAEQRHR